MENTSKVFMFLLSILFFTGSAFAELKDVCKQLPDNRCYLPGIVRELESQDDILPDEAFFKENCGTMIDALQCLDAYNQTCPKTGKNFGPIRRFTTLESVMTEFCDETSPLRKKYMTHRVCLNENSLALLDTVERVQKIIFKFEGHVDELIGMDQSSTDSFNTAFTCLLITLMESAIIQDANGHCGEDAADTLSEFKSLILLPPDVMCPEDESAQNLANWYEEFSALTDN